MRLAVIGVPFNSAGVPGGEARAPRALRAAGLLAALGRGNDVVDFGDVRCERSTAERDPVSGIIAPRALAEMVGATRGAVGRAFADGRFPIVVGGECPLLLGCLAAARDAHGRMGLLFVDGHEDAWPPHRSPTGESADMELGFALGLTRPAGVAALAALLPLVRSDDVFVLGARDRPELEEAGEPSVAASVALVDDAGVRRGDIEAIGGGAIDRVGGSDRRWWLHLDLDVLSTEALAAVRYPQPGGLGWEELRRLTEPAFGASGLVGWNLTIYNPELDPDGSGAARIVAFVGAAAERLAARRCASGPRVRRPARSGPRSLAAPAAPTARLPTQPPALARPRCLDRRLVPLQGGVVAMFGSRRIEVSVRAARRRRRSRFGRVPGSWRG